MRSSHRSERAADGEFVGEDNALKRLGILLSGRGSNFIAIAEAIRQKRLLGAQVAVVLSNRADAPGLKAAQEMGLPAFAVPSAGRKPYLSSGISSAILMVLLRTVRKDAAISLAP